jgi:hypothetical protein
MGAAIGSVIISPVCVFRPSQYRATRLITSI